MTAPAPTKPAPQPHPAPAPADPSGPFPTPWPNAPWPAQLVTCPTCGGPVASLLAACWKPECLTADLDYDAAIDARNDDL